MVRQGISLIKNGYRTLVELTLKSRPAARFAPIIMIAMYPALFWARPSHAAQDAVVAAERAEIHQSPDRTSSVLESRSVGEKVRVSSTNREGWYKVKAKDGQFGWIWQADIALSNFAPAVRAGNLELKDRAHERREGMDDRWLFFRLGGNVLPGLMTQVSHDAPVLHLAIGGFAEASVRVNETMYVALRLLGFSDATVLRSLGSSLSDVVPGGTLAMIGINSTLSTSDRHDLTLGLYGGPSLTNSITVVRTDNLSPNAFPVETTAWGLMALLSYRHPLENWLNLVGEAGLLYVYTPKTFVPQYGDPHLVEFGPTLGAALEISF